MTYTYQALMQLAAADLLPVAHCPVDEWVPLDCPATGGMQCPCCFRQFSQSEVTFMDDAARQEHGLIVTTVEEARPEWHPTVIDGGSPS